MDKCAGALKCDSATVPVSSASNHCVKQTCGFGLLRKKAKLDATNVTHGVVYRYSDQSRLCGDVLGVFISDESNRYEPENYFLFH